MPSKGGYRLLLALIVVVSTVGLVAVSPAVEGRDSEETAATSNDEVPSERSHGEVPGEVPPREGITVVATDSNVWLADEGSGPRQSSELVAYGPDGDRLYVNGSHDRYWDVDPSPEGERTVLYAASEHLNGSECNATTVCTRNVIERVDLSTGEVNRLYERVTPRKHATRWHDVDRIDDERFVVADIYRDAVFVVNVTTGIVEWEWMAQQAYDPGSGGPFPEDWTHLNDVEVLDDGRIMVSLRNQDQVVFLDRDEGVMEDWTLGEDREHEVLHNQHNPDFIPSENGGPAVVIADSENNRLVEYQRTEDDEWNRTWVWQDARMQWPRDADRLPNGNTLVADSNGDRVLEVNPSGEVVWSVDIAFPYEVERLETGDESTGGPSAAEAGLESRSADGNPGEDDVDVVSQGWVMLKGVLPGSLLNSVVYVTPSWFGPGAAAAFVALVAALGAWVLLEYRWSPYRIVLESPIEREGDR